MWRHGKQSSNVNIGLLMISLGLISDTKRKAFSKGLSLVPDVELHCETKSKRCEKWKIVETVWNMTEIGSWRNFVINQAVKVTKGSTIKFNAIEFILISCPKVACGLLTWETTPLFDQFPGNSFWDFFVPLGTNFLAFPRSAGWSRTDSWAPSWGKGSNFKKFGRTPKVRNRDSITI